MCCHNQLVNNTLQIVFLSQDRFGGNRWARGVIRDAPSVIMATAVSNMIAVFIEVSVSSSDRRDASDNPAIVAVARDRCP